LGCIHRYFALESVVCDGGGNECVTVYMELEIFTPKTASVVPPEDERLTPETCRGLRHNKVTVNVKVY
jgi:hypothetical protein